jgi:NAD(P)-dependent dehydrogenase (short-subunit alcohol dehydrogenase family)
MKNVAKYFKEYKVSNIVAMIRNNSRDPELCTDNFTGKLVVISGATSGIGYATAREYAAHGARLLCINRNKEKSEALKKELKNEFGTECDYFLADLSNIKEIHRTADELRKTDKPIDVLIHNAGVFLKKKEITTDRIEKVYVVQYLASFIINIMLMDKLLSQDKARIIYVNSEGHRFAAWGLDLNDLNWEKRRYTGLKSYGSAKLSQLLTMHVFNEYFKNSGVTINAMHPGAVKTETGQENGPLYRWYKRNILDRTLRPVSIASDALYFLGVSKKLEGVSGKFFNLTKEEEPAPPALDIEVAYELWAKSLLMGQVQDTILDIHKKYHIDSELIRKYGRQ